jgi:hypothetical protein
LVVIEMVSEISDRVVVQEYSPPQPEQSKADIPANVKLDDRGNMVVVSKDFILNLLSLAVGGRAFEGNLGKSVDVKV